MVLFSGLFEVELRSSVRVPQKAESVTVFVGPELGDFGLGLNSRCFDKLHLSSGSGRSPTGHGHTSIEAASPAENPRVMSLSTP